VLDRLKSLLQDPPPAMAFEISEAGIAAARIGARAELGFQSLKPGSVSVSPLRENLVDPDDFALAVRALLATQPARKRRDVALILPDFCTRIAVLDFDDFPTDPKEQLSLVRFRLKRSVPFDVDSAAVGYWAQTVTGKKCDVVVVMTPLEIISRYEAPFRAAGMNPGFVTPSVLPALELAADSGVNVVAKISGHVLTVVVRTGNVLKLVRCLEVPSSLWEDVAAVLMPTFVFIEDNLGARADRLMLCGFGAGTDEAQRRFQEELEVPVEPLRSPWGLPGENNAGLLGYLRSIGRYN
jgi:type IV pilus assembly protein PilM